MGLSISLEDKAGIYCISHAEGELPSHAEDANCESLETAVPWAGATFPFTIAPEIEEVFEDKVPFEGDDTDLIESDGGNFIIPDYQVSEEAEESL